MNGDHGPKMLSHIMTLDEKQVVDTLEQTLREFARRHVIFQVYFINIAKKSEALLKECKSIMMGSQMNENAHWLLLYYGICYRISVFSTLPLLKISISQI
jgi:hypothetical protein